MLLCGRTIPGFQSTFGGSSNIFGSGSGSSFGGGFGSSFGGGFGSSFGGGFGSSFGREVTLESLENDPIVQQIRELGTGNPERFKALLEQLVRSKPQIMTLIATNPAGLAMLFCRRGGSSRPESQTISVTSEEKGALDRLESLGFPRAAVIQAYFAFEKNEELAANYLIENVDDI
ncbi:unnamed protein product [Rhizoctonia solani]|uniref:UV excision repair protein RAD23 n=1 Tax=Rhizoctonia solani TaxID=456999 RepID=A0A8H3CVC0_9AGAM|nr:unnamed protein product [Rhizoctonia solani]